MLDELIKKNLIYRELKTVLIYLINQQIVLLFYSLKNFKKEFIF